MRRHDVYGARPSVLSAERGCATFSRCNYKSDTSHLSVTANGIFITQERHDRKRRAVGLPLPRALSTLG